MSSPATTPMQSLVLTGLSTVVGVLFLTVAGKVVDKVSQALVTDAVADVIMVPQVAQGTDSSLDGVDVTAGVPSAPGLAKAVADVAEPASLASTVQNQAVKFGSLPTSQPSTKRSTVPRVGLELPEDNFAWDLSFLDEGNFVKHKYDHGLKLHSRSAFIVDLDSGEILFEKAADTRRPSASVTKVLASLTLANKDVDLDAVVCTDHRIRTGINGAVTRVAIGDCATGWDFMGAALVSSDNGAAFAFPLVADEELFMFAHDMNQLALDLGMSQSEFVDPAGIYDDNISTARDLTRASIAAAFHPTVAIPGSAKQWVAQIGDEIEHYTTTNKAAGRANFLLAKTGFTNTARANFTGVYEDRNGRRIAFTIMGAWNPRRRTKDIHRIIDWVRRH